MAMPKGGGQVMPREVCDGGIAPITVILWPQEFARKRPFYFAPTRQTARNGKLAASGYLHHLDRHSLRQFFST